MVIKLDVTKIFIWSTRDLFAVAITFVFYIPLNSGCW